MSEFAPSRGTRDLLPPDGGVMRALYDRAAEIARLHGFRYVETPGFEATEVFARTSGATSDVVSKEMYTFTDRGDRSLTLRRLQRCQRSGDLVLSDLRRGCDGCLRRLR